LSFRELYQSLIDRFKTIQDEPLSFARCRILVNDRCGDNTIYGIRHFIGPEHSIYGFRQARFQLFDARHIIDEKNGSFIRNIEGEYRASLSDNHYWPTGSVANRKLVHHVWIEAREIRDDHVIVKQMGDHLMGDRSRLGDLMRDENPKPDAIKDGFNDSL
jgi:hypothetical protein